MIRWYRTRHRMWMTAWVLVSGTLIASSVRAQVSLSPSLQAEDEPAERPLLPKVITISPMAQPDPMLRYRLWPAPELRKQENPAALISRAVLLVNSVSQDAKEKFAEKYEQWSELPINELPQDEVQDLLDTYTAALDELQRAEHLMRIDYDLQLDELSAGELVQTLLPEFQEMRQLARLLQLRARLALAQQRWGDAVRDLRVGFRLAEFAGRSTNFLIGRLVGFAVSGSMMNVVEEAIQQPECPNLYWALAGLPVDRLFETKQALEFESVLMARLFDIGGPLPDTPIGAEAARERIKQVVNNANRTMVSAESGFGDGAAMQLMAGVYVVSLTEPSRELLAETEQWSGRVDQLSSAEAVLRATLLKFARVRDRWVAWSTLPDESWDDYAEERQAAFGVGEVDGDVLVAMANMLMPAVDAARRAGLRTQQQHHFLATIESLRLHAAATGQLPESLDKLRPVPAWPDAMAGKPFQYQRTSATTATLIRTPRYPNDQESNFQIQLRGTP